MTIDDDKKAHMKTDHFRYKQPGEDSRARKKRNLRRGAIAAAAMRAERKRHHRHSRTELLVVGDTRMERCACGASRAIVTHTSSTRDGSSETRVSTGDWVGSDTSLGEMENE